MSRIASIKLYIDADAFEAECNEPLEDGLLEILGSIINDELACYTMGYSGWAVGWETKP